jgi:hypothetical protein
MGKKLTRIYHAGLRKYADVLGVKHGWVTVSFDENYGVCCYELDAPYIIEAGMEYSDEDVKYG